MSADERRRTLPNQDPGPASTVPLTPFSGSPPEDLKNLVKGELARADDLREDATVYWQLRQFLSAMESLQKASRAMESAERYLGRMTDAPQLRRFQSHVRKTRERIRTLEQSIVQG